MNPSDRSKGTLYVVATPIGNLGDITLRAIETLKTADLIACEDTRASGRLLSHFDINTRMTSYHDHNEMSKAPELLVHLLNGESVALISDAGTPLISDPGFRVVSVALQNNIDVVPIPGPSSALAALAISGFATDRFCFEGYLPRTSAKLERILKELSDESRTMIFFETTHRIFRSLKAMLENLGDREILVARELTKRFEEKIRGRISDILLMLENRTLKGEIVIVVPGTGKR
jgi:16S rRNA (cytidine1402-2'-O)-methyltransferase